MTLNYQKVGLVVIGLAAGAGAAYLAWRRWGHTYTNDQNNELHTDSVDVAGAESFPASDPPAFTANRASH